MKDFLSYIFAGKIWWVCSICSIFNTINGVVSQECSMALSIEDMFCRALPGYQNICNLQNDLQPVILLLKIAAIVAIWEEPISETCNLKLLLRYFLNVVNSLKTARSHKACWPEISRKCSKFCYKFSFPNTRLRVLLS